MNRSRRRKKRLGIAPYGAKVVGVDIPDKMQRRMKKYKFCGVRHEISSQLYWLHYWYWREMKRRK